MRRVVLWMQLGGRRSMADGPLADPCLYSVPTWATSVTGRNKDVLALWQRLLGGQRVQVVQGMDGLGKSSLVSSFCECARSSGRFSCIQWFDGTTRVSDRVTEFVRGMKGRMESDVLVVLDDVDSVDVALAALPKRSNLYVIITSSKQAPASTEYTTMDVVPVPPNSGLGFFVETNLSDTACEQLVSSLQGVPILMFIASRLIAKGVLDESGVATVVKGASNNEEGALSVSAALTALVEVALASTDKAVVSALVTLAHLYTPRIGEDVTHLVALAHRIDGDVLSSTAEGLGLLTHTGDDAAVRMHNGVRSVLMKQSSGETLSKVATTLLSGWPNRMRGRKAQLAGELPWHNLALLSCFKSANVVPTVALLQSLDKGASFLALQEGAYLGLAADQWVPVYEAAKSAGEITKESVRAARDLGRVLYVQGRHEEAASILHQAVRWTERVYGRSHPMFGLVLGAYAPYLDATEATISMLDEGISVLASPDHSLSTEEAAMMKDTLGVLLLCKAQTLTDLGKEVPDTLRASIQQCVRR